MRYMLLLFIPLFFTTNNLIAQTKDDSLYVFVGEKISVERINDPSKRIMFDAAFITRYKIVQKIYGNYKADTITFKTFDHYGTPLFSKYKNVLLFVHNYKDSLYHVKYQYFDVYKTMNGRWATVGDPYWFGDKPGDKRVKAVKVDFVDDLCFDALYNPMTYYPRFGVPNRVVEPYFQIDGCKGKPTLGTYAEDLFLIKKNTTLKGFGFFKDTIAN